MGTKGDRFVLAMLVMCVHYTIKPYKRTVSMSGGRDLHPTAFLSSRPYDPDEYLQEVTITVEYGNG